MFIFISYNTINLLGIRNGVVVQTNVLKSTAIPTINLPGCKLQRTTIIMVMVFNTKILLFIIMLFILEKTSVMLCEKLYNDIKNKWKNRNWFL